ncbi:tripartite tricarboxylate transporter substrate binding protein [Pigmentiphaga sp. NML080357]|uniref:tripartite tricarboxylate transporter substrate binding protein n=1 Tax=Pigmentiphaga sp. NML080357 TaxID=2008675 RepID=UPI001303D4B0|nr:tripartite tricarboxylate transporter substrate binding protein [Pigmentiphaga sp. NML080357]
MRSLTRIAAGAVWAAGALLCLHSLPAAADWPDRPIKLIVPFAPGGSNDNLSRIIASKLGARLGQAVVVDNRGGAGGTIGTDMVAKAPPDGYTLLFASTSIITNSVIGKSLPYDVTKDLAPVGEIGAGPFVVVVANSVKAATLHELIDLARAAPKKIFYGSAGVGGINHLGTELLASAAGIQLVHVPYKGISLAFTDLMANNLQMLLPSLSSAVPYIREGRMRALAITSDQRSPLAPEIPTASEAGLPGFRLDVWWGLMAPARTPPAVVKRLNEELNAIIGLPEVRDILAREGAAARPGTPDQFGGLIKAELERWAALVKSRQFQTE